MFLFSSNSINCEMCPPFKRHKFIIAFTLESYLSQTDPYLDRVLLPEGRVERTLFLNSSESRSKPARGVSLSLWSWIWLELSIYGTWRTVADVALNSTDKVYQVLLRFRIRIVLSLTSGDEAVVNLCSSFGMELGSFHTDLISLIGPIGNVSDNSVF